MLDNFYANQNVNIKPACTGTLQKSHPKSYFDNCRVDSPYWDEHINGNPRVLQIILFGDRNCIAEILPEDVYKEWIGR